MKKLIEYVEKNVFIKTGIKIEKKKLKFWKIEKKNSDNFWWLLKRTRN